MGAMGRIDAQLTELMELLARIESSLLAADSMSALANTSMAHTHS